MARRPQPPIPTERPRLTVDQKRNRIGQMRRGISELEVFDPQVIKTRPDLIHVQALEASIDTVLASAFGTGTPDYHRFRMAAKIDTAPRVMQVNLYGRGSVDPNALDPEIRDYLVKNRARSILLLQQAIQQLEDEIADEAPADAPPAPVLPKNKVFVVHGHDDAAKHAVARFLEKIGIEAIILSEQPDQGRTIIEKFEDHANEVGFAVVLLTPDDVGQSRTVTDTQARARQNVIFELGYFVGKLGRGRACLLRKGDLEIPSDLAGVIYTELDPRDGWHQNLVRELKAARMQFDANRLWE